MHRWSAMDDLLQEFIAETRETLSALSGEIVAWEADPSDRSRLDAIFRFVHTVKGSCGFLDLPRLARLSHAAEDVLQAVRSGARAADADLVNAILAIIDRIGEIVEAIDAGAPLDDTAEDQLLSALTGSPPVASASTGVAVTSAPRAPARSIRLSVDLLDRMMNGVSEMVLARNDLARRLRDAGDPALETAVERLSMTVSELRNTVTRTRMQAIDSLFSALPRLVRDTAAGLNKKVGLVMEGADVELDREMIELLRDPLVHIIRNALDHGIESPDERVRLGKPEAGRLSVVARQSGNRIIIDIADDGRGIDTARVLEKRIAQEPARAAELLRLSERARLNLVFEPGLSTRDDVTDLSGRGVGMDVVRTNVEQIGGSINLLNVPGRGLTTSIEVPLTLAILSAILVEVGDCMFGVPRQSVEEIIAIGSDAVQMSDAGDAMLVVVRGRRLPLARLSDLLGLPRGSDAMLILVNLPGGTYALTVDAVVDTQELVVKPVAPAVMAAGLYAGQMLPDTGQPMLLLDCAGVASAAGISFERAIEAEPTADDPVDEGVSALLFEGLDGRNRVIALELVDRIEAARAGKLREAGGGWWLNAQAGMVPLRVDDVPPPLNEDLSVLLLQGAEKSGYLVRRALDIVTLRDEIVPVQGTGSIVGVTMLEGEPVEIVDSNRGDAFTSASHDARPICLLHGEDLGWLETFLRPAIEAAGYRVKRTLAHGEEAAITLTGENDRADGPGIFRLSRDAATGRHQLDPQLLAQVLAAGERR